MKLHPFVAVFPLVLLCVCPGAGQGPSLPAGAGEFSSEQGPGYGIEDAFRGVFMPTKKFSS
jgi:hypothetical protein